VFERLVDLIFNKMAETLDEDAGNHMGGLRLTQLNEAEEESPKKYCC
jgi:hypothetical protein